MPQSVTPAIAFCRLILIGGREHERVFLHLQDLVRETNLALVTRCDDAGRAGGQTACKSTLQKNCDLKQSTSDRERE